MNSQGLARMRVSSLHLQQGLFASLALLVTLIGGQQLVRWEQAPEPSSAVLHQPVAQQHFSAATSSISTAGGYELMASDETRVANSQPTPERWVF